MKILQYMRLQIKNIIRQILHHNTFHFLAFTYLRFAKCLFKNIRKQQSTLKSGILFKKTPNLWLNTSRILNFQGIIFEFLLSFRSFGFQKYSRIVQMQQMQVFLQGCVSIDRTSRPLEDNQIYTNIIVKGRYIN